MKKSTIMLLSALVITMLAMLVSILLINSYVKKNIEYGSGNIITKEYLPENFQNIDVKGFFEITLKQAPVTKVYVTTDDNFQKYVEVSVKDHTLYLSGKNVFQPVGCNIVIQCPDIRRITLQGGTSLVVEDKISSESLFLSITGGVRADISGDFMNLKTFVSAGSQLKLKGTVINADYDITAGSVLMAGQMVADSCDVKSTAGSTAEINVLNFLNADVWSGSTVRYSGKPETGKMSVESGGTLAPL